MSHFYNPWKPQKTTGFLTFSGGIETWHWAKMGEGVKGTFERDILGNSLVMLCAIWYHLYNLKIVKGTHGGVLLLVKLQVSACNFTKKNTSSWVFLKLYKLYQKAQSVSCYLLIRLTFTFSQSKILITEASIFRFL